MISLEHRSQIGVLYQQLAPGEVRLQPAWCQNCFKLVPTEKLKHGVSNRKYCIACAQGCFRQELEAMFLLAEAKRDMRKLFPHGVTSNNTGNRRPEPFGEREQHTRKNHMYNRLTSLQLKVYMGLREDKTLTQIVRETGLNLGSVSQAATALRVKLSNVEFRDVVELAIKTGVVEGIIRDYKKREPAVQQTPEYREMPS